MKVTDITTKVIIKDDENGCISFAIKALVENDSDDINVYIILQGLDSDGFELHALNLDGEIPLGEKKYLTTKEDYADKELFEQIVKWQKK